MKINIGISEEHRIKIAQKLSALLADSYTLYLKTQNFHWNVTGPNFPILHAMFEQQYTDLASAIDELAERIRALGFQAPGSYSQFMALATIQEEATVPAAEQMVGQLLADHETVIHAVRSILATIEAAADEVSLGLLTERLAVHEKTAWMLRSLLA